MLSKLRHSVAAIYLPGHGGKGFASGLQALLGADLTCLSPLVGGTLGVCFTGELNGKVRFFKTHAVLTGRQTLKREVVLLGATAADRADACLLDVQEGDMVRSWLHMKALQPCKGLPPEEVRNLVAGYEESLRAFKDIEQVPSADNIHLLLSEADSALAFLSDRGLLSVAVLQAAKSRLDFLQTSCGGWPLQLCHGDLGPANILTDGGSTPLAIDWEDAFWGVAGYDYLYWLTFFDNRQWLSPEVLGHTSWGRGNEVALMVAILLLKCLLSVRDGSYRHNTISFDQRLSEVLDLD